MAGLPRIWERQEGDKSMWFDRFEIYRMLGPERNVSKAFQAYKAKYGVASKSNSCDRWSVEARRNNWKARADAWDDFERMRLGKEREDQVDILFANIEQGLRAFYGKFAQRLAELDPNEIPTAVLVPHFLQIVGKLEEMYGRDVAKKIEVSGRNGGPLNLSANLDERKQLLAQVENWERSLKTNNTAQLTDGKDMVDAVPIEEQPSREMEIPEQEDDE